VSGYGPEWDAVLRGLVFEAHALKDSDEFDAALHAIVDAHAAWPLAEMLFYLDDARELLAESEQAELDWYDEVFASKVAA
jgi:hypothetical protein